MMKRQILMKKMQAVRSGAGGDIVAHNEIEGEMIEGLVSMVKKGAKRHAKAVEKKKIKDRKAVPYAALAAETELEGEVIDERIGGAGTLVRQGIKVGGKKGGRVVQAGTTSATSAGKAQVARASKGKAGAGNFEKAGALVGGTIGVLAGFFRGITDRLSMSLVFVLLLATTCNKT